MTLTSRDVAFLEGWSMSGSRWHRIYTAKVAAPPARLFELLADMPNYTQWLPPSEEFSNTTAVDPYPVRLGSRYHDGRPEEPGKDWWGTVTGFQPPGSLDFHHTIRVAQLRATVDVHIHYSFEPDNEGTVVNRWLLLDFAMPLLTRPLRRVVVNKFDNENVRTLAAVKEFAEANPTVANN
jgi:uncharacterized protein YndB with AHSA1/START domain